MKIFILLSIILSNQAWSMECSSIPEEVENEIRNQSTCYQATKIARECGFGSLLDLSLVDAAAEKCLDFVPRMDDQGRNEFQSLLIRCDKKYENEEGTLAVSMHAHCQLNVIELMHNLYSSPMN